MEEIVLDESDLRPRLLPGALDHEVKRSLIEGGSSSYDGQAGSKWAFWRKFGGSDLFETHGDGILVQISEGDAC